MAKRDRVDSTEGVPADEPTNTPEEMAQKAASMMGVDKMAAKDPLDTIDPRTNQPMRDFFPQGLEGEDAEAARVQQDAIKVAGGSGRAIAAQNLMETRERDRMMREQAVANAESVAASNPLPREEMAIVPPDVYRARERARVLTEARAKGTNRTVPGGRFKVNGVWVNANGEPVKNQDDDFVPEHVVVQAR